MASINNDPSNGQENTNPTEGSSDRSGLMDGLIVVGVGVLSLATSVSFVIEQPVVGLLLIGILVGFVVAYAYLRSMSPKELLRSAQAFVSSYWHLVVLLFMISVVVIAIVGFRYASTRDNDSPPPTFTPTNTRTPTFTPTNTPPPTFTPANTRTPTFTPTNTRTPTFTPTNTPTPRTGKPSGDSDAFPVLQNYDPSGYMGDIGDLAVARQPGLDRFVYETRGEGPHEWEWKYVDGPEGTPTLNPIPCQFAGVMYLDPPNNWGTVPDGGFDLREWRVIKWEARSLEGEVNVQFVIGGVTWLWEGAKRVPAPYPDSMPRISLGIKTLNEEWQEFEYDLSDQPEYKLRAVIGGLGWTISWGSNEVRLNEEGTGPVQSETFTIEIRNARYER